MKTEETLRALLIAKGVKLTPERFEKALNDLTGVARALRMGENDDFIAILAALETWNLIGDERTRALQAGQVKHLLQLGTAVQEHVTAFGKETEKALQGIRDDVERIGRTAKDVAKREAAELESAGAKAHGDFEKKAGATLAQMKVALAQSLAESRQDLGRLVAETAQTAAKAQSRKEAGHLAAWFCAAVLGVLVAMGATFYLGNRVAEARAHAEIEQIKATGAFFETDEGARLREMWEDGELKEVLFCKKRGWKREGDYCIPGNFEKDGRRYMQGFRGLK